MKGQGRPKRLPMPQRQPLPRANQTQEGVINNAPAFNKGGLVAKLKQNLAKRSID